MELVRRDADYAVRALVMIAREELHVQTSEIAARQEIPFDFLHKILRKLKDAGMVNVKRGAGGGFSLARSPEEIRLLGIIEAIQGPVAINLCFLGKGRCPRQEDCTVHERLKPVQTGICEMLEEITLYDLINGESRSGRQDGRNSNDTQEGSKDR